MKTTCAVCVAHPGHELLIHQWLRREQPLVFILTDGSGHEGQARFEHSRRLLESIGAPVAACSGRFTDRETYELILDGRSDLLATVIEAFALELIQHQARLVVADAPEGYNPVHDLSRLIAGAACSLAAQSGRRPVHYEFSVVNPQANSSRTDELVCYLSDAELEEKIAAARNYCALRDEVDLLLSNIGTEPLRTEVMRCVPDWRLLPPSALQPGYELIGEQRVASGRYQQVIRYTEHMAPLQQTLLAWLEERSAHPHHQFIPRPRGRNPSLRT